MYSQDSINKVQKEAQVFLNHAIALSNASESSSDKEKIIALDANLKLWVEIETTLLSANNYLPQSIKENLTKLSKFVERLTLSKGINMEKQNYDCLSNINMQISHGLLDAIKNHMAKEDAFSLVKCAVDIADAKDNSDEKALVCALDNNLRLWVYIKSIAASKNSGLPESLRENLIKLSEYVSSQTFKIGQQLDAQNFNALESLIKTNLQISEGLMSTSAA